MTTQSNQTPKIYRLLVLLFLLCVTSNSSAMLLFEPIDGPRPIDIDLIQASKKYRLIASWDLGTHETLWEIIKRSVINENIKNDPRFKKLSQDESIAILQASHLPISIKQLVDIKDGEYNANELKRFIREQRQILSYKATMGDPGFLEFIVGIASLVLDPMTFCIFLLIGLFTKKYRTCLILTLTTTFILGLTVERVQFAWRNIDQFNGAMWWLKLTLGGCFITFSMHIIKKISQHSQEAQKSQLSGKTKPLNPNTPSVHT